MTTALFWAITQCVVVIRYRRFGTTYWNHIQGSKLFVLLTLDNISATSSRVKNTKDSWPSKMLPICCPETSVRNYHYSLCNSPVEHSSHLLRGVSLKSNIQRELCQVIPRRKDINCRSVTESVRLAYLCYNTEQTNFDQMTSEDANFQLCCTDYCWKWSPFLCVHSAGPLKRESVSFW